MSRTLFIEDIYGEGWESEISEDMRIEPREPAVRGLTPSRYFQLWQLFPNEPSNDVLFCLSQGHDVARTAEMVGMCQRQVKNAIAAFLTMARHAYEQPTFLPRPVATNINIERRPRSRRGRPPKGQTLPAPAQVQIGLPF